MADIVKMALSSIYIVRSLWDHRAAMSRREMVYRAERIGDSGEP